MKLCTKCGKEKELNEFHNSKNTKDGKRCACRICINTANRTYQHNNKKSISEKGKIYREKNKEPIANRKKNWAKKNKNKIAVTNKKWYGANISTANARGAKYRATKSQATPIWYESEKEFILFLYSEANRRGLTVDHDVPLQHSKVCGLHTIANLQLMSGFKNDSKGNKFNV